jgi:meso-butanediol dehydrogenase/(S,S)-butanediol dehydrogenase/diacetyl reductase
MTSTEPPVTLVTGAASGIGRATAELLLGRGGSVVAVDRSRDALDWVVGRDRATTLTADVTSEADNGAAVAAALSTFGRLDGLVLNAGAPASGPIEELDLDVFDACLEVNLRSVVLGLRAALPALRESRGAVVVTASVTALGGEPTGGRTPRQRPGRSTSCDRSRSTWRRAVCGSTQSARAPSRPA